MTINMINMINTVRMTAKINMVRMDKEAAGSKEAFAFDLDLR